MTHRLLNDICKNLLKPRDVIQNFLIKYNPLWISFIKDISYIHLIPYIHVIPFEIILFEQRVPNKWMLHNSINGCFIIMQVICAHWKLDAWIIFSNPTIFLEIERSVVHSHTTMILTHQKIHVVMKANSLHYTHHRCRTGFWRFQEENVLGTMTFFEFGFRFRSQRRALKCEFKFSNFRGRFRAKHSNVNAFEEW